MTATITTRSGKGSPLTMEELDANFQAVADVANAAESSATAAASAAANAATAAANKQEKLTPGTGINIDPATNVISATGGGGTVVDASPSTKGVLQLAGPLGGSAAAPTVFGLADTAAFNSALAGKASLNGAAFTASPTAPTPAAGDNSTKLATTAFAQGLVNALLNGAGPAFDTLKELQAALGDDPNFATTVMNALGGKASQASVDSLTTEVAGKQDKLTSTTDVPGLDGALTARPTLTAADSRYARVLMAMPDNSVGTNDDCVIVMGDPPQLVQKQFGVWVVIGTFSQDEGYTFPLATYQSSVQATAVVTFESIGLYWKAAGSDSSVCLVRYRKAGSTKWLPGHPFRWDGRSTTTTDLPTKAGRENEYRGSIVECTPGTQYEIELCVQSTGEKQTLTTTTWAWNPPEGVVTNAPGGSATYQITTGGTESAYAVYDFGGATIDVARGAGHCIDIAETARYVIVRNAVLKGATWHALMVQTQPDAGTKPLVIIEHCDISGWGTNYSTTQWGRDGDSGVGTPNNDAKFTDRLVVRNCKIHHPFTDANNWTETSGYGSTHPAGPQAVTIFRSAAGQNVICDNSVYSDDAHCFNDAFGSPTGNISFDGFPFKDSDIARNKVSHCWDEAFECEGGDCNVRLWGNFSDLVFSHFSTAVCSVGPFYAWKNIGFRTRQTVTTGQTALAIGTANKNRTITDGTTVFGGGWAFWYHNTFPRGGDNTARQGVADGFVSNDYRNTVAKNNIIEAWARGIVAGTHASNEWDYNIRRGSSAVAAGQSTHDITGTDVTYDPTNPSGAWTLASTSIGRQVGTFIPNFSPSPTPDIGAVERGLPAMSCGANW